MYFWSCFTKQEKFDAIMAMAMAKCCTFLLRFYDITLQNELITIPNYNLS